MHQDEGDGKFPPGYGITRRKLERFFPFIHGFQMPPLVSMDFRHHLMHFKGRRQLLEPRECIQRQLIICLRHPVVGLRGLLVLDRIHDFLEAAIQEVTDYLLGFTVRQAEL